MKKINILLAILFLFLGFIIYSCNKEINNKSNLKDTTTKHGLRTLNESFYLTVGNVYNFYVKVNESNVNKISLLKDSTGTVYVSSEFIEINENCSDSLSETSSIIYLDFPMDNISIVSESEIYLDYTNLSRVWEISLGDGTQKTSTGGCSARMKTKDGEIISCCCMTDGRLNTFGHCRICWQNGPYTEPNSYCRNSVNETKCDDCGGQCKKTFGSSGPVNIASIIIVANDVQVVSSLPL